MVYREKQSEAEEILKLSPGTEPSKAEFMLLAVDSDLDGVTMRQSAMYVMGRVQLFKTIAAEIEDLRLKAKRDVIQGLNAQDARLIVESVSVQALAGKLLVKGIDLTEVT